MGEVWRGRDTRLDRSVAIKILPAEFSQNSQLKLRFEREARAISQLNHPNICTLYDVGDSFLVMELLEGETLADRIVRGPLPLSDILRFGVQIAEALDRAHRAGIVHRDLKPANVMITKSGAKLLDFGLAKSSVPIVAGDGATVQKALTQEGTILGTFQYMAPEQLEGEEADARADIFALGTLLYEMATGMRAFGGKTRTSLIAAIVTAQPLPIRQLQPLTPAAFEHVVEKCLAKDRESRWQSAYDVAEELRWIGEAGSQTGVAAPISMRRRSRQTLLWSAAIILAIGAGILVARGLRLFQPPSREYRLLLPTLDSEYRNASFPQLSPDGQTIYFGAFRPRSDPDTRRVLFRRRLADFHATPIEGTEGGNAFVITPDGRNLIVGFSGGVLKRISVDGGPQETIAVVEAGTGSTVGADGTILIGSGNLDLPIRRVMPNKTAAPIMALDTTRGEVGQHWPVFLPPRNRFVFKSHWPWIARERQRFLFLSVTREPARGVVRFTLCATALGSKEVKRIGDVPSRVDYALGNLYFVRDGTLMAQPFDVDSLAFAGEPVPIISDVFFNSRSGSSTFSVARDGTIACSRVSPAAHLTWVDQAGRKLGTVGSVFTLAFVGVGGGPTLSVSGQGDRVIVPIVDHHEGTSALWIQGLTRETSTRVTFSPAAEVNPVVTPDGSRIFFASDAQSALDIFEAPLDGSEPPKVVVAATNLQVPNDISPDGRFLLFTSNQNQTATKQDLWVLPLNGDRKPRPFLATPASENGGVFSPDGKWIAYDSDATGTFQVYVRPFPGPGPARPVSTTGGNAPRFSVDGKRIFFENSGKVMAADFRDGLVGEPQQLFEMTDRIQSWQPVGDRFLMVLASDLDSAVPSRVIVGWHAMKKQ